MFPRTCDVRHVGILFHFFINSARFRKKCFVFFSFVVRFRLVIRFYSHFFVLLVRCFPQHQVFQQKRLYSSCQAFLISSCNPILFYSGENRWFSCNLRRHKQQWWNEQMLVDKQSENERSFVYHPPAWRRWRNVKTTYIACCTWNTFFCCFTNFSSLKLNIMTPKINTDYSGQVWQINLGK